MSFSLNPAPNESGSRAHSISFSAIMHHKQYQNESETFDFDVSLTLSCLIHLSSPLPLIAEIVYETEKSC